jgi:hypothetical protein
MEDRLEAVIERAKGEGDEVPEEDSSAGEDAIENYLDSELEELEEEDPYDDGYYDDYEDVEGAGEDQEATYTDMDID